jgi:hypothetical protein
LLLIWYQSQPSNDRFKIGHHDCFLWELLVRIKNVGPRRMRCEETWNIAATKDFTKPIVNQCEWDVTLYLRMVFWRPWSGSHCGRESSWRKTDWAACPLFKTLGRQIADLPLAIVQKPTVAGWSRTVSGDVHTR